MGGEASADWPRAGERKGAAGMGGTPSARQGALPHSAWLWSRRLVIERGTGGAGWSGAGQSSVCSRHRVCLSSVIRHGRKEEV